MKKILYFSLGTVSIVLITVFVFIPLRKRIAPKLSEKTGGEYMASYKSPNGTYSIKTYLVSEGGATVAHVVRCELYTHATGKTKNIYWKYKESNADVNWIEDNIVKINDIILNVEFETYYERNG